MFIILKMLRIVKLLILLHALFFISNNILPLPTISENNAYVNIKHLILNRMNYTWSDV